MEDGPRATLAWSSWCHTLPPEASTSLALMQLPHMPGVPEALAGKFTAAVRYVYTGSPDDGARWLAPMRAAGVPLMDAVQTMPFSMIGMVHSDPEDALPASEASCLLADFGPEAAQTLLRAVGPGTNSPQLLVEIRQFGGALSEEPAVPSALCHRDAEFGLYSVGVAAPPELPAIAGHAAGLHASMGEWHFGASLPNFSASSGAAGFAASYTPDVLARLTRLAAHYDPDALFRLGQVPAR